jgi:hypothetical protein
VSQGRRRTNEFAEVAWWSNAHFHLRGGLLADEFKEATMRLGSQQA